MDDHYDVTVLQCHACAARDRKAWNESQSRERDDPPSFGRFFVVQPEPPDDQVPAVVVTPEVPDADLQVAG